jgi:hypothetical protein
LSISILHEPLANAVATWKEALDYVSAGCIGSLLRLHYASHSSIDLSHHDLDEEHPQRLGEDAPLTSGSGALCHER